MSVSDNVGSVKFVLGALVRELRRARHFALDELLPYQPRLASIICRSGTQSDPCISSIRRSLMIASSNYPDQRGGGCPIDITVFYFTPSLIPGWPACGPNFFHCS